MERRLAAILAVDMVGYSKLMAADEAGTIERMKLHRAALIDPKIAQYGGRIVKTTGDGMLVEFPSVVDAVQCAVEIQCVMPDREAQVLDAERIRYRVGINLGDIVIDGEDILGDGVNIAARLEGLAEPGGICISRPVHTQIADKLDMKFEDLGEQQVKNIAKPVIVYRVALDEKAAALVTPVAVTPPTAGRGRWPQIAAGLVLGVVASAGLVWWQPWAPDVEPASVERMAFPLPDKPSIAVLPFTNMSDDPEQEYFVDGMTEDLITDLSKISGLFVIARNSSFSYKGQQVKVRQVAEELGVRYVVEGSVRRAGDEVRINAQLTDAATGGHLWAERFDGKLADVFAVQDEITQRIAHELAVIASADENERLFRRPTTNFAAYELFLSARRAWEPPTRENIARGRALFEQVVERDPGFAGGYAGLSLMHALLVQFRYSETRDLDLDRAAKLARKALDLDPGFGWAHTALGTVHLMRHKTDAAVTQARAAIRAQPGDADAHSYLSYYLQFAGRGDEAIEAIENAMRLNPRFQSGRYSAFLALAEFQARRYADAIQTIEQHFDRFGSEAPPKAVLWALLAAANYYLGHDDQARHAVETLMTRFPELAIETWDFFGLYKRPEDAEHALSPLRNLGFPVKGHQ